MSVINTYFIDVLKNHYFDFSGTATRKQFWLWVLFQFLFGIILGIICGLFFGEKALQTIQVIVGLLFLLPALGIAARRLHDSGRSGWWLLLWFLPFIGPIVLLVFFLLPSKR